MEYTVQKVNAITQVVCKIFIDKANELPWSAHPYAELSVGAADHGGWTDENIATATNALAEWVQTQVGRSCAAVLREVINVTEAAKNADEAGKQAAHEMSTSMNFLESMLAAALCSIDVRHVAEKLFEHGREAAQKMGQPKAPVKTIKNWETRIQPSAN